MVLVYHTNWRVVPIELKDKLWDGVKVYSNVLKLFLFIFLDFKFLLNNQVLILLWVPS